MDSNASPARPSLPAHFRVPVAGEPHPDAVVAGDHYRFTVLTSRLIRLEYSESGVFEDRASQLAVNRRFDLPDFRVVDESGHLQIITEHVHLSYDKRPFSANGLTIAMRGNFSAHRSLWRYSVAGETLGGTARTLDDADGAVELEPGILSRDGFAIVDDSETLLITDDGWFSPRSAGTEDLYFFGYGRSYRECLSDFYGLAGPTPLLPRFALGNWWSRFYPYSQNEYKTLIERFAAEQIPFSVAVIDMDWHHVDIESRFGSGWTGYTWNTSLFPDPDEFADWLHERGLRLTLNVHPADGVQAHEEAYPRMAEALGVDPGTEDPIAFDVTEPAFLAAYFEHLHHPLEDRGVDFWWLDWQSGSHSKIRGLDPLWMLNHLHFLDSARDGRRPLTFSRYAGPGSHRYPVGFSGDTVVSWKSLDFQPYFTASASNIGYGWWSHDIGGHLGGGRDDDLAVRWTQLGVFSPILRLHSSSGTFNGKEPWRYGPVAHAAIADSLRLRHALLPYLHTMNHRAASDALPLVQPMYYEHPEEAAAYDVPNQFLFGSELVVCPITTPLHPRLGLARVKAWLPPGTWIDFFTGLVYRGDRTTWLHRPAAQIPVLARAGAVVPLAAGADSADVAENPTALEIRVFAGADGSFELIEDGDTASRSDGSARTRLTLDWANGTFTVHPTTGDATVVPDQRDFTIRFVGFTEPGDVTAVASGRPLSTVRSYDAASNTATVAVEQVAPHEQLRIAFADPMQLAANSTDERILAIVNDALIDFDVKEAIVAVAASDSASLIASRLHGLDLDPVLFGAVLEIVTAHPHETATP